MTDFTSLIESLRRFYTRRKENIIHTIYTRGCTKEKSNFICWNQIDISIDTILRRPWYDTPGKSKDDSRNEDEKKKFFQTIREKIG